jgi:SWI/SNF-related matrix-associated actin-dependent regulator 1 of chromatin subfamily A
LLADEMGLGKTAQALTALPPFARAVVVCPKSLRYTWAAECARWRPDLAPVLAPIKSVPAPEHATVSIHHYESLPDNCGSRATCGDFDALIVDEAHRAKNTKTKISAKLKMLRGRAHRVWLLTGTPLLSRPLDLRGVLGAAGLFEEAFGNFRRFVWLFNAYQGRYGWVWGTPRPEVAECMARVTLRRLRSSVLAELPQKTRRVIAVGDLSAKLREQMDAADGEWNEYQARRPDAHDLPPFEIISSVRQALAEAKIAAMLDQCALSEESGAPLVVYSAHRAPIDALVERAGWATITGETPADVRATNVEAFQAGRLAGLGLTIAAGGVGLTLTRAAHALFVDLDWNPAANAQAEDRLCRIGQTSDRILISNLEADHPLERRINEVLSRKARTIDAAIVETRNGVGAESDYSPRNPADALFHG